MNLPRLPAQLFISAQVRVLLSIIIDLTVAALIAVAQLSLQYPEVQLNRWDAHNVVAVTKMITLFKTVVVLIALVVVNSVYAQTSSTVDHMKRQRDSLDRAIKLEQLRMLLVELNSSSDSFIKGEEENLKDILLIVGKLYPVSLSINASDISFRRPVTSSQLGSRTAVYRAKPKYSCSSEGIVAVKVYVDRQGNVVRAEAKGQKASTTADECLIREAEVAALNSKFEPDSEALELQVGTIMYSFQKN